MEQAIFGGVLVGLGAGTLLLGIGRIAGIGGIYRDALFGDRQPFRFAFVIGLVIAGALTGWLNPEVNLAAGASVGGVVAAGLVGGIGASLANGCASGHGVCGVARLSPRSITAVALFCTFGIISNYLIRGV